MPTLKFEGKAVKVDLKRQDLEQQLCSSALTFERADFSVLAEGPVATAEVRMVFPALVLELEELKVSMSMFKVFLFPLLPGHFF